MASDHNPILINTKGIIHTTISHKKPFKLEPLWIKDGKSQGIIKQVWASNASKPFLQRLKDNMWSFKMWGDRNFSNLKYRISETEKQFM